MCSGPTTPRPGGLFPLHLHDPAAPYLTGGKFPRGRGAGDIQASQGRACGWGGLGGGGGEGGGAGTIEVGGTAHTNCTNTHLYIPVHDTKLFIIRLGYLLSESNVSELLVPAHNRAG